MTDALLIPDPTTLTVGVKADVDGDVVVERFTDARTNISYVVARDPQAARDLATLLETAVTSPRIGAEADQARAARRERG